MDTSIMEPLLPAQNSTPRTYARSRSRTLGGVTPNASPVGTPTKMLMEAVADLYVRLWSCIDDAFARSVGRLKTKMKAVLAALLTLIAWVMTVSLDRLRAQESDLAVKFWK